MSRMGAGAGNNGRRSLHSRHFPDYELKNWLSGGVDGEGS